MILPVRGATIAASDVFVIGT